MRSEQTPPADEGNLVSGLEVKLILSTIPISIYMKWRMNLEAQHFFMSLEYIETKLEAACECFVRVNKQLKMLYNKLHGLVTVCNHIWLQLYYTVLSIIH